jgi:hypothetical protein
MHQRVFSWLLVCALFAAGSLRAQSPAPSDGPVVKGGAELILVAKVAGTVTKTLPGQASVALKQDDRVEQTAKINTGLNSSIVLVFSNGATTQLGADTELVIEEYLQDPFSEAVKVAELTAEPSQSRTKLALNRGELVGNVKKLKYDKGSSFIVQTPVGAAGIRGTTFRIVFRPSGTGQAFFTLSTAIGNVAFEQPAAGGAGGAGTPAPGTPTPGAAVTGTGTATGIAVPQGQEIAITVDVTQNASGQMVVTVVPPPPAQTSTISTTTMQQVSAVASEIAVAVQQAVFTPPPATPPSNGPSTGTSGTGTGTSGTDGGTTGSTGTKGTTGSTTVTGQNFNATVQNATVQTPPSPPPPAQPARIVPTNPSP